MSLDDDIAVLCDVPLLREFGDDHLRLLAFGAEHVEFRQGDILFRVGDAADAGFVILSGAVELRNGEGEGATTLRTCTRGALLGERAMIAHTRRPADAVAIENTTTIRIRRALLHRMLNEYPQLAHRLRDVLAHRIEERSEAMARIGAQLKSIEKRGNTR